MASLSLEEITLKLVDLRNTIADHLREFEAYLEHLVQEQFPAYCARFAAALRAAALEFGMQNDRRVKAINVRLERARTAA